MEDTELVAIYRSADPGADEEAEQICDLLVEQGLTAIVVDDSEPGVVSGCYEVRVPQGQFADAERVLAEAAADAEPADPSDDMELISLFEEGTSLQEMEAINLKVLLESNGIPTVIVGTPAMPNLPFEVRVPADLLEQAEEVVAAAVEQPATDADVKEASTNPG